AVVDEGQGLAVVQAVQQDDARVRAGGDAILLFGAAGGPVDDVGLDPDSQDAVGAAGAGHAAPAIVVVVAAGGRVEVDTRHVRGLAALEVGVADAQGLDGRPHVQHLLNVCVG